MANEQSTFTLLVKVSGAPLSADIAGLLASGYVDDSLNLPDVFELRFTDNGSGLFTKAGFSIGAKVELSVQPSGSGAPTPLMSGEVTALEADIDALGTHLLVRGMDKSHRLFRGRRVAAYKQMKAMDIAKQLAQAAGLEPGRINCDGPVLKHVAQDGISDWEFLRRLGDDVGAVVAVVDGKLDFRQASEASDAPSDTASAAQNPLVLERGRNLISLRSTVTASDQVSAVEVRGWDVATKQALVGVAQPETNSAQLSSITPAKLASTMSSRRWVEPISRLGKQRQCELLAAAVSDRLAGSFAELEGVARGNPELRAGTAVALANVGTPFDGRYTLSATRHHFSPEEGYHTTFSVSNVSDRSLYGVTAARRSPAATISGVLPAVVTNVQDPENLGRVKVKIPVLDDTYESWWARTVQPGAGGGRGAVILPEVNDEVLVAFGQGHIDEPYVLGGVYNGVDKPDKAWGEHVNTTDGSVQRRAFASRTGMVVEMIEKPSEQKLTLSTSDGQRVTLTQKGKASIEIAAEGPVTVTAKQDITISTSGGNVSIKGTDVTIDAGGNLSLKANGNATVDATNAEVKAKASVKVTGQAQAELSATGQTVVRGGMVQIN